MPKQSPTQNFVPIKEIRDGVMITKDGYLRSILLVSSMNFSLKSSDEQVAIISQFQGFLNSLDFSLQIFVESRKLDIRPYVATMEERHKQQTNDLIRIQTKEYIDFIKSFTESVNIMSKNFFVVVPYSPPLVSSGPFKKPDATKNKMDSFEEDRSQLEQRIGVVEQGLSSVGLRTVRLGTEEVIELVYKIFNPGESEKPVQVN